MSFIYIAPLVNKLAFKVGKSEDPVGRLMALSRFYNFDFKESSIVDCNSHKIAYRIENALHSICEKKRVFFDYDGGTEFFDYSVYEKVMTVVNVIVCNYDLKIDKMPSIADIKKLEEIKSDDIDCLVNALTNKIRNKRLEYNITQQQLAKVTGLSLRTIRNMETEGTTTLPNFIRILKALDLDNILSELEVDTPMKQRSR